MDADSPTANISAETPEGPLPPPPDPEPEPPPDPGPDPPVVDGFAVWLNSEEGLFQDVDGTTPIVNGTRVALWEDQSGNNNHAEDQGEIQIGFPSWPLYRTDVTLNGYPVVEFNDVSKQRLASAGNVDFGATGLTVFAVASFTNSSEVFPTIFAWVNATFCLRELNSTQRFEALHVAVQATDPGTYTEGDFYVFAFRFSDALNQLRAYLNDVTVATSADANAMPAAGRYAIGGRMDTDVSSFFHGYLVELLVYPEPLNDAEVSQVNQQLMTKYAL